MKPLRFALLGDPVAHSKSPLMHAAAFREMGLPHTYEAIRVTADELPAYVQALREGTFAGLNVTVPHKIRAAGLADVLRTHGTAAANTLLRDDDARVVAFNTDVPALTSQLTKLAGGEQPWLAGRSLVLGSGGAAQAAIQALLELGAKDIAVRARTPGPLVTQALAPSTESEARTQVIVQATSAGMAGAAPGDAVANAVAWDAVPRSAMALDVVYAPPVTPFLEAAERRGMRSTNGLGMLATQGAVALDLWLGGKLPLDPLEVMLAALARAS
jgi:shikimate dehydrogenase